ncbi:MAG: hypothetical protein ACERKK_08670, partial [Poseidonibacter sp.]|uniref:hypothetical protein n=1 Tax=Poseidonibacter sp. TaxID=2321188 RepID=UPI00359D4BC0
ELEDRNDIGKSATLNEDQINEIPKLEQGVAVVYQNGWEESILCKIQKSKIENQTSKYKYTKSDFHINKKEIFSNIVKIITLKNENVITKDLDELLNHFNGNKDIYRMWSSKNKIKAEAIEFINNIESKDISEKINIINKLFKANKLFNNYKSFSNEENKMNIFNYLNSHLINASDAILNIIYRDIIIANLEQEKQLKHIEALRIELNNERVK